MKCDIRLLEKLAGAFGVSGQERDVREIIRDQIKPYVDTIRVDSMGNLVATKRGKPPRIMLAAHMDEVGLMVKKIGKKGRIYVSALGEFDAIGLIGQKVHVLGKRSIEGVITTEQLSDSKDSEDLPKIENLIIDTGYGKEELEAKGIGIGSYVDFMELPKITCNETGLVGKALDDRIGCYILIEVAKAMKSSGHEINYVFTVQEEVGLYGAKTATYKLNPDWAVAVDVSNSDELSEPPTRVVGKGPVVVLKDAEVIGNKCLNDTIREIARKKNIPLQLEVSDFGTTDALSISVSKGGVPTAAVGVVVKNIHTTFGMGDTRDIENAAEILIELLRHAPKRCLA